MSGTDIAATEPLPDPSIHSVYTTQNQMRWNNRDDPNDGADVKSAVQALLGCASEEKNSVNGVVTLDEDKGERVCIGDRAACGDCFSD